MQYNDFKGHVFPSPAPLSTIFLLTHILELCCTYPEYLNAFKTPLGTTNSKEEGYSVGQISFSLLCFVTKSSALTAYKMVNEILKTIN